MQKKDISECMTATFEPDSFIVSKMVKVIAEIFTSPNYTTEDLWIFFNLLQDKDSDDLTRSKLWQLSCVKKLRSNV